MVAAVRSAVDGMYADFACRPGRAFRTCWPKGGESTIYITPKGRLAGRIGCACGAPSKAPVGAELTPRDIFRAWADFALDNLGGRVVEGHVPAEFSVRHRNDDIAEVLGFARRHRRAQQRIDRG